MVCVIHSPAGWGSVPARGAPGVRLIGTHVGISQSPAMNEANEPLYGVEFIPTLQQGNHQYGDFDE
jgi:hypothetical protein